MPNYTNCATKARFSSAFTPDITAASFEGQYLSKRAIFEQKILLC